MTSGHCWPSAADEEWYSPKRPFSTVAVNSTVPMQTAVDAQYRDESPLFLTLYIIPARQN